jgi:hypothetical protein
MVGILKVLITIPALIAVDRLGRRPLMIGGTITMTCAFYYIGKIIFRLQISSIFILGIFYSLSSPESGSNSIANYIAIGMIYIFMAGYALSWGIMHYCLPAELYPLNIRAKAQGIGAIVDWTFQVVAIKMYPYLIDLPNGGVYYLTAGLLTLFLIWIIVFLPETKGLGLEEVDLAFDTFPRWKTVKLRAQNGTKNKAL